MSEEARSDRYQHRSVGLSDSQSIIVIFMGVHLIIHSDICILNKDGPWVTNKSIALVNVGLNIDKIVCIMMAVAVQQD